MQSVIYLWRTKCLNSFLYPSTPFVMYWHLVHIFQTCRRGRSISKGKSMKKSARSPDVKPKPKRKAISNKLRFDIFKRDYFTCQYCSRNPPGVILEIDHIIPVKDGGLSVEENLVTACFDCNRGKAAKSLAVIPESL